MMQASSSAPVLEIEALTRAFGGLVAVNALDLTVRSGEIVGLLGPNGSGKTTALNLISGVLRPDAGTIRFAGHAIQGMPAHRIARLGLARTFQLVRVLNGMNCADNVKAGLAFHRPHLARAEIDDTAVQLLQRVGLTGQGARPASELTYIDRKRLELARSLALKPRLLQRHIVVGTEIVEADHLVPAVEQAPRRVIANEAGGAGNQDTHRTVS